MKSGGGGSQGAEWPGSRLLGPALALGLFLVAAILAITGAASSPGKAGRPRGPRLVRPLELQRLEAYLRHPLYWAGPRPPASLELTEKTDGSVYVRYLPPGAKPGDPRTFLTVGTYPLADAEAALRRAAHQAHRRIRRVGAGTAFFEPESRESVYLAFPHSNLEIEVYDPRPGSALGLVASGSVRPLRP